MQRGAQTLLDLSYEYNRLNSVGNASGKTGHLSKITNNIDNNKNREYEYDALGRLTKAKGGNGMWTQTYAYDRYGNRTSVTATGVAADSSAIPTDGIANLSYNTTTNRITTTGFEYDVAGNQTRALDKDGQYWLRFDYDTANRISVIKRDDGTPIQAFQYSPSGGRLMNYDYAANQQTLYANTGGTTLSEYIEYTAQQPTWTKSYVYLGGGLLSTATSNGQGGENIEFNHPDRLGTRTITNQAAGTSNEQAALPFGTALNAESTRTNNPNRFTSYDRSNISGLDYAVNRSYDPKQGRFTQVDPIKMGASSLTSPQTLNLYTYCGNDPINHTDPSGLFWGSLFRAIGKIFSVVNRILKWVAVAIIVAAVVIALVASPGAAIGFLKAVAGVIGNILGISTSTSPIIINFAAGTITGGALSISIGLSGQIIAGLYSVGAIANSFSQTKDKERRRGHSTAQQAAIAFLRRINPISIRRNKEIAAFICKLKNGTFVTGKDQIVGSHGGTLINDCPKNSQLAGGAHAHGRHDANLVNIYGDGNEVFSPTDMKKVFSGNVPEWIATPSGDIHRLNPDGTLATVSKIYGRTRRR